MLNDFSKIYEMVNKFYPNTNNLVMKTMLIFTIAMSFEIKAGKITKDKFINIDTEINNEIDGEEKIKKLEDKISELENENAALKAENAKYKNGLISDIYGDINNDGIIDGRDATVLLTYYAKTSTGYTGSLEEFVANAIPKIQLNERQYEAIFVGGDHIPYKSFTPADQIIKGEETALKTISRKIGKNVQLANTMDTISGSSLLNVVFKNKETQEQLDYHSVKDFSETERIILFLFNDDTDAVIPEKTDINFITSDLYNLYSDWHDEKYHNENNYNSQGIFSWYVDGASHAIFSENAGSFTSVWAYDPVTNKADIVWRDNENCPVWIDYHNWDQYQYKTEK